jgi:hypothetical protein
VSYLSYVLGDEAAHHEALVVDEQVGLGLGGTVEGHLLEAQLSIHVFRILVHAWHSLTLMKKMQFCLLWHKAVFILF